MSPLFSQPVRAILDSSRSARTGHGGRAVFWSEQKKLDSTFCATDVVTGALLGRYARMAEGWVLIDVGLVTDSMFDRWQSALGTTLSIWVFSAVLGREDEWSFVEESPDVALLVEGAAQ